MAVRVLKELSQIGRIRMLAEAREFQRRDNQAALEYDLMEAQEQKALEIARRMKTEGFSVEQITRFTGLSPEDVAGL
jgi:predicted transposase/invertase (TIGR01784 family)